MRQINNKKTSTLSILYVLKNTNYSRIPMCIWFVKYFQLFITRVFVLSFFLKITNFTRFDELLGNKFFAPKCYDEKRFSWK